MNKTNSYLTRLATLEILLAAILVLMPLFLRLGDNGAQTFRDSISDYVYMPVNAHLFGMFLAAAACMFIYNGVLHYRKEKEITQLKEMEARGMNKAAVAVQCHHIEEQQPPGKNFNIIFGLSLLGVLLFPHEEYAALHYVSAAIFFAGSIYVMAFVSNKKFRKTGIFLAVISALSLALYFANEIEGVTIFKNLTLFWAEWIALTAIAIHYVLEANYKADMVG